MGKSLTAMVTMGNILAAVVTMDNLLAAMVTMDNLLAAMVTMGKHLCTWASPSSPSGCPSWRESVLFASKDSTRRT